MCALDGSRISRRSIAQGCWQACQMQLHCAVYVAPYGSETAWHIGAGHKRKGLPW